ncbi:MAG TPA: Panacea domain-containing protein [Pirellulales bacterium]
MTRAFRFDERKTIQAVAFLLRREPGHRMNYMRLLKILYIAEREAIQESGKPLTGSRVIAMQRGPVLEDVLSLIRGQHIGTPEWARFIRKDRYFLEMVADPGVSHLTKYLSNKLEEVATRYEDLDEWEMVEETHRLPEWKKNDPGGSSREIPFVDILDALGRRQDLERIIAAAREDAITADYFSGKGH